MHLKKGPFFHKKNYTFLFMLLSTVWLLSFLVLVNQMIECRFSIVSPDSFWFWIVVISVGSVA